MLSTQHSENNLYTEQQSLVTFFFLYFHCTDAIFLSLRSLVLYTFCFFPAFISFLTLLLLLAGFTERIFQPQFDQCMYHFLSVNSQAHPLLVLCPPYPSVCLLVYTMFRQKCVMWNKDLCQLYIFHCYLQLSVEYPPGVESCMINTTKRHSHYRTVHLWILTFPPPLGFMSLLPPLELFAKASLSDNSLVCSSVELVV